MRDEINYKGHLLSIRVNLLPFRQIFYKMRNKDSDFIHSWDSTYFCGCCCCLKSCHATPLSYFLMAIPLYQLPLAPLTILFQWSILSSHMEGSLSQGPSNGGYRDCCQLILYWKYKLLLTKPPIKILWVGIHCS